MVNIASLAQPKLISLAGRSVSPAHEEMSVKRSYGKRNGNSCDASAICLYFHELIVTASSLRDKHVAKCAATCSGNVMCCAACKFNVKRVCAKKATDETVQ